jgi:hypothetical protein
VSIMTQRMQAGRRRSIWGAMRPTPSRNQLVYAQWAQAVHHGSSWHRKPQSAKFIGHQNGTLNTRLARKE